MPTVLIVEDEPELNTMVGDFLTSRGFEVVSALDGAAAIHLFFEHRPDIVVLDLMIPGLDGLQVTRTIRAGSPVPIIMLTARSDEDDRLAGFDAGADDYVPKPFSMKELEARIRAVLRRSGQDAPVSESVVRHGPFEINAERHTVYRDGRPLDLTAAQFALFATLIGTPGRVFTRMQLLESIQDVAYEGYERTIDAHIKNIRKRIEPDPRNPRFIETVRGVGYRFAELRR